MSLLTLPKQFNPDFRTPNKKPINLVEIDQKSSIPRPDHVWGFANSNRLYDIAGNATSSIFSGNTSIKQNRIDFTGAGDYIGIPNPDGSSTSLLSGKSSFVISMIINMTDGSSNPGLFSDYQSFSNFSVFLWVGTGGVVNFWTRVNGTVSFSSGGPDITDGKDHHIIASWNGVSRELIIDGVLVATSAIAGTLSSSTSTAAIGAYSVEENANNFTGQVDHIALWLRPIDWRPLVDNPYEFLTPTNKSYLSSGAEAGPITVQVGISSEDNTALTVEKPATIINIDISSETDSAIEIQIPSILAVDQADETDTALSITPQQDLVVSVGLTLETDISLDVSPIKDIIVNIGLSEETDDAFDIDRLSLTDINTSDEIDSALDILPIKDIIVNIGTSEETNTTFDTVPIKDILVSIGQSSETDTAFNVFAISEIGQGQEVDEALVITPKLSGPITIQVNIASEADRALALVSQDQAGDKVISNIIFPIISNIILPIIR